MNVDYIVIGKRIRELRIAKNWSQAKLAEKSGVEPTYISNIELGKSKLSLPTLISIANGLNATLDEIVYTHIDKNTHISNKIVNELLADCTSEQMKIIIEVIKTLKNNIQ